VENGMRDARRAATYAPGAGDAARWVAAVPMSLLPARYWHRFPTLPVEQRVLLSAILTMAAAFALGIPGFLAYAERVAAAAAGQALEVARLQVQGRMAADAALTYAPLAVTMFSPIAFALLTPLGLLSTYLLLSGLARVFGVVTLNPFGDPLLTSLDTLARRTFARRRDAAARRRREREEGADVPDRLFDGAWAGRPDVELVVVSARRKPGWEAGTFVITPDRWYTLGTPFDRRMPDGRLRTCYPLTAQTTNEVLRKGVPYDLPPLTRTPGRSSGHAAP
jgi:hypothetical protein